MRGILARMFSHLERPEFRRPSWREALSDFSPRLAANGFIGWVAEASNFNARHVVADEFRDLLGRETVAALSSDYERGTRLAEVIAHTFDRIGELIGRDEDTANTMSRFSEDRAGRNMTIRKTSAKGWSSIRSSCWALRHRHSGANLTRNDQPTSLVSRARNGACY